MSFFVRSPQRYYFLNRIRSDLLYSTSRMAKKKIDPFVEELKKENNVYEKINKSETFKDNLKSKIIRDFIPIIISLGIFSYFMYFILQKRKESIHLDDLNVKFFNRKKF